MSYVPVECDNYTLRTKGSIYSDTLGPYNYVMRPFQFIHPNECMQHTTNFNQTNRWDAHLPDPRLTDIESDLRNITRILSKLPQTRFRPGGDQFPEYPANQGECKNKIVSHGTPHYP